MRYLRRRRIARRSARSAALGRLAVPSYLGHVAAPTLLGILAASFIQLDLLISLAVRLKPVKIALS